MVDASSEQDLDAWLAPFLAVMGRKTRRAWAPFYVRGLLGPGERKSLQPMAARLGLSGHDQLQHFIASLAWDDRALWTVLAGQADRLVGGPHACLVIDDTALPKKGTLSVGVARQYCGQLGKKANCQALVSLTLARGEVPVPVALRLFLPEEWVADPQRCAQAGVPEATLTPQSKGEIALAELDRLRAGGLRFGTVLADAGYGTSAVFRHGLDARGLTWAVGLAKNQKWTCLGEVESSFRDGGGLQWQNPKSSSHLSFARRRCGSPRPAAGRAARLLPILVSGSRPCATGSTAGVIERWRRRQSIVRRTWPPS